MAQYEYGETKGFDPLHPKIVWLEGEFTVQMVQHVAYTFAKRVDSILTSVATHKDDDGSAYWVVQNE